MSETSSESKVYINVEILLTFSPDDTSLHDKQLW